jgi:hypothetical protein
MWRIAIFIACIPGWAAGQLFAIDVPATLVTVDPDSGAVTDVGTIALQGAGISSLEFVGDRLFAVESRFPNGASILELDPESATIISRATLTLDDEPLFNGIEGLGYAADPGALIIAFWRNNASNISTSNTLGFVGAGGVVTDALSYGPGADFDGLGARGADGSLYWVDREPGPNTVVIGTVTHGGTVSSLTVFNFNATLNGVNAVTFAPSRGQLLAVDVVTRKVHRFDPATAALLGSVDYDAGRTLNVGAWRTHCAADLNNDGTLDFFDVQAFLAAFAAICP